MVKVITLDRMAEVNGSMVGLLRIEGLEVPVWTLEDGWKGNQRRISCIPAGTYTCRPHGWEKGSTVHFKQVWEVTGVPGRSAILLHAGNTDADTEGCILCGLSLSVPAGGKSSILQSRDAIDILRKHIGENSFTLVVNNPKGQSNA